MSICLIFPYGGEAKWIELSLREFTVQWLIILANESSGKDFASEARKIVNDLGEREKNIPKPKQRKFSVLVVPNFDEFADLLAYFRALHQIIASAGYTAIYTHLDSGLMRWRIALYQCAEEFPNLVRKVFLFNKATAEKEEIRIFRKLHETETQILQILSGYGKVTLSQLHSNYIENYSNRTLSAILKVVKHLSGEGLTSEKKEGRIQWVEITNLGRAMLIQKNQMKVISEQLGV